MNQLAEAGDISQVDVPATGALAQLAATYVILAPVLSTMWRRAALATLSAVAVLHLILAEYLPASLFLGLALGATIGWAVLFTFGRPDARPTEAAIRHTLADKGLTTVRLHEVPSRSATAYFADQQSGGHIFVKVRDDHQRANDLIFRVIRYLRMKDIGDETLFATPRRATEHEALGAIRTRDIGVRVPRLRALGEVEDGAPLLAYDVAIGTPLDKLTTPLGDESLRAVWRQLAVLRQHGMAHRDLRQAKVILDVDGSPWLVGFGRSDTAANPAQLHSDVAQLLVTLALAAGAERSVATAISELGPETVAEALPRLQTNAMPGTTRAALKRRPGLMKEIAQQVIDRCGVGEVHYVELERLSGKTLLSIVMLIVATYFLLPQLGDLSAILRQIGRANWLWALPAAVMSAVTYVGAAMAMAGAVPERLRVVPTTMAQVASSFAGLVAPAGVGGMALNARFLQKSGIDSAVAVSSVGLNTVAGVVVHVLLLLLFVVWAGRSAFQSVSLPNPEVLWYGAIVVAVLAIVALAFPAVRGSSATRCCRCCAGRWPEWQQSSLVPANSGCCWAVVRS
jgi:tRNA A-37 threonylcarbamoyl transferase component Bud32